METQFDNDTMKAMPTPRFEVGEKVLAPQLLDLPHEEERLGKIHPQRNNGLRYKRK